VCVCVCAGHHAKLPPSIQSQTIYIYIYVYVYTYVCECACGVCVCVHVCVFVSVHASAIMQNDPKHTAMNYAYIHIYTCVYMNV